ncbi:hypothetical protein B0T16DRAFT_391582 [Cercophora newfieldiana]|uniref:Uncharacterized protein n=1 Tax=Cercophora newfieldiana TaxID=92897 RepID=A0AA39XZ61_9PEZI|nr:hypothetical protein B0T16DRAFT_391582 [Cercophora newfieldiana]
MSQKTTETKAIEAFFRERNDWPRWQKALKWVLTTHNVLHHVNFEDLTVAGQPTLTSAPKPPNPFYFLDASKQAKLPALHDDDNEPLERTTCTEEEFTKVSGATEKTTYEASMNRYDKRIQAWEKERDRVNEVKRWIHSHVDNSVINTVEASLTLHALIAELHPYAAVDTQFEKDQAIDEYNKTLALAGRSIGAQAWLRAWIEARNNVQQVAPEEIAGIRGIRRFLNAAQHYNAPLVNLQRLQAEQQNYKGLPPDSLVSYGEVFKATLEAEGKTVGATLGGRNERGESKPCVCGLKGHDPVDCFAARTIVLGEKHEKRVKNERLKATKKALETPKWKWLVEKLKKASTTSTASTAKASFPEQTALAAAVMANPQTHSVSATHTRRHRFADSTIWDNGANTHVVNSEDLLLPGSITKADYDDWGYEEDLQRP